MSEKIQRGSTGLALKAGTWYVISNFLVKGLAFITTPIFARLMSESAYGEFTNYASWQSILFIVTSLELYNTLSRAYYDYTEDFHKYISSVAILGMGITTFFYLMFLVFGDFVFQIVDIPREYVHVLFFYLFFYSCKELFMARERTLYRYRSVAVLSVFYLVIPTLIAVAGVIMSEESMRLSARIYGIYFTSGLFGLFCAIILLRKGITFKLEHCKYALKLSIPLTFHYLTTSLLTNTNTTVTKSVLGAEAAAMVGITTSGIHIVTILLHAMSGALTTWLMDNLEQKKYSTARKGLLFYVAGISLVSIGVILLGPEMVWILGGSRYAAAADLVPGMILATTIQSIITIFTITLTYRKKVVGTAISTAIVAALSILAKIYLLPHPSCGIDILPWINIASYGALFVCGYLLVRSAGYSKIINLKGFLGCILVVALVMFSCYYLYDHTIVRYAVIALIGIAALVVIYLKRDLLITLLKKRRKKKSNASDKKKAE